MKLCFSLLLFIILTNSYAQQVKIGQYGNRSVVNLNYTVPRNATTEFDLDCDGQVDISFTPRQSNNPAPPNWPSSNTTFSPELTIMSTVTTGSSYTEAVTLNDFEIVDLKQATWQSKPLYCGNGRMGFYGQIIDNKTVIFRKATLTDTAYFFIKLQFFHANIIIQQIVSDCPAHVLNVIGDDGKNKTNEVLFYPNPFTNSLQVTILNREVSDFFITNLQGKLMKTFLQTTSGKLDLTDLPAGSYIIKCRNEKSNQKTIIIKN